MRRVRNHAANENGQGTVEYLLMLCVVVGEVLVFRQLMITFMPRVFNTIQIMIVGGAPLP